MAPVVVCASILFAGCSNGVALEPLFPTSPTTSSSTSTSPTATPTTTPSPAPTPAPSVPATVAYQQDLQPIFATDCVPCHNDRQAAARYSMSTYSGVMAAVRAGSASSPLVVVTQPGGFMYGFFTGDRATKAALVARWVAIGAPQSR
jgi:hypothetical protein